MSFWSQIPYVRLAYTYECQEELLLPAFKGSALRGAFGHALKKVTCVQRRAACDDCLLRATCVYLYVFETPPPPDSRRLRLYPAAPHPFVIRPPRDQQEHFQPGEKLTGELLLIGKAIEYLPYFVYALEILGQTGLGRGRGRAELQEIQELDHRGHPGRSLYTTAASLISTPDKIAWREVEAEMARASHQPVDLEVEFLTPVRLKSQGRLLEHLEYHHIIRNLLRRLASLAYFHGDQDPEDFDFKQTIAAAVPVRSSGTRLHWQDWERYSARQQTRMLMGGLLGTIRFSQVPPPGYSLLLTGEQLHVGKMASFGLGQYVLKS